MKDDILEFSLNIISSILSRGFCNQYFIVGQFYVPLLRAEDNTTQPMIGQPWSPDSSKVPLNVAAGSWSPKDPLMAVKACAGPMTPSKVIFLNNTGSISLKHFELHRWCNC